MEAPLLSSDQVSFFLNLAVVGAALFGLTLVALASFAPELMKRFEICALPAFPHRDKIRITLRLPKPYSLSDQDLMDGDPVVIFVSYSIGVSWNLFCMPLAVGFSAAYAGSWSVFCCALEMIVFVYFIGVSLVGRQKSIQKLNVYLTREEPYWGMITWIIVVLLAVVAIFVLVLSVKPRVVFVSALFSRIGLEGLTDQTAYGILKSVCVFVLVLGTYTLNKDVFIYLKVFALEKVRKEWLRRYVKRFKARKEEVKAALSHVPPGCKEHGELESIWNHGIPPLASKHMELAGDRNSDSRLALWNEILAGEFGVADWMIEVPEIAIWDDRVTEALERCTNSPHHSHSH